MGRKVQFFTTTDGKCPAKEFLDSLPGKTAQKAVWALQVMEERNIVPASYFKKLEGTEDIWECRGQHGTNTFRILDVFRRPRHPRAHARIHQEEPKDAGKGNREGGELQEGFPIEEKGP